MSSRSTKPTGCRAPEHLSDSTKSGIDTAAKSFDKFLEWLPVQVPVTEAQSSVKGSGLSPMKSYAHLKGLSYSSVNATTSTIQMRDVTKDLFLQYSLFMTKVPYKVATDDEPASFFTCKTAKQYIMNMRNTLAKRFPLASILGKDDQWFTVLSYGMVAGIARSFMQRGEAVSSKTPGTSRDQLVRLVRFLVRKGTVGDISMATAITIVWLAVGRAGEVGNCTWEQVEYIGSYGITTMNWSQTKTGLHTEKMPFVNDASSWEADFYHAIARYIIIGGNRQATFADARSSSADCSFVFPFLANISSTAGSMTECLAQIISAEGGAFADLEGQTSKSLRVGSTDHMSLSSLLNIIDMAVRGGWDFSGECTLFTYITALMHQNRAGKVLAGYSSPDATVVAPTCDAFLTTSNAQVVENLVSTLLSTEKELAVNGRLRNLLYTMFATIIMYLPQTMLEDHLGREHVLHKKIFSEALRLNINSVVVLDWAAKVKARWISDNLQPAASDSPALVQAQRDINEMKKLVSSLATEMSAMRLALEATQTSWSTPHPPPPSQVFKAPPASSTSSSSSSAPATSVSNAPDPAVEDGGDDDDDGEPAVKITNIAAFTSALSQATRLARNPSDIFGSFLDLAVSDFLYNCYENNISNFNDSLCFGKNITGKQPINHDDIVRKKGLGAHVAIFCQEVMTAAEKASLAAPRPDAAGPLIAQFNQGLRQIAEVVAERALTKLKASESALALPANKPPVPLQSKNGGGKKKGESVNSVGARIAAVATAQNKVKKAGGIVASAKRKGAPSDSVSEAASETGSEAAGSHASTGGGFASSLRDFFGPKKNV
jgi:hypothetical protein